MDKFARMLDRDGPIILDGGLATQLESMGHDIGGALWSAVLLARNPRAIVDAHRAYLDAGADIIISASYQASRDGLLSLGLGADEADRLIASSVELAITARDGYLEGGPPGTSEPLVAASVGPSGTTARNTPAFTT
jgi:homocysteine S-methyltransferase